MRRAFEALGLLERGKSRIKDVTSAIRGFQHMFELEPDGLMNPGGETVKTLRDTFGPREKPPARVPPYRPGGDGGKFTVLTGGEPVERLDLTITARAFPRLFRH